MKVFDFKRYKIEKRKISMVTCYDYSFAKILAQTEVDTLLVGDSVSMVMHGEPSTLSADVSMLEFHTKAVSKGAPEKFLISDLPFLSYRKDLKTGMDSVERLMKAGAHAVKLEGVRGNEDFIHHVIESGVPVIGHLGLTPQFIHHLGGYKVQGRDLESARAILEDSKKLQDLGCTALVLECVPEHLASEITLALEIPTIGIGAGRHTDGQVLVLQDLLGMNLDFKPKFVKRYLEGASIIKDALDFYHREVMENTFPSEKETFQS